MELVDRELERAQKRQEELHFQLRSCEEAQKRQEEREHQDKGIPEVVVHTNSNLRAMMTPLWNIPDQLCCFCWLSEEAFSTCHGHSWAWWV